MSTKSLISKLPVLLLCFLLSGCIDEITLRGVEGVSDILVVEGIITDGETVITLTRSENFHYFSRSVIGGGWWWGPNPVTNAEVFVEREDGMLFFADPPPHDLWWDGRYTINMGTLNPNYRHRLRIKIDEHEYQSEFAYPIQTPEIDSIFWIREHRDWGPSIAIYVSTHDPNNEILHYRWSYTEDWELHSAFRGDFIGYPELPFQCWGSRNSFGMVIGSAARTGGLLAHPLISIWPSDQRLSVLYRVSIRQNAISHRAFTYFENIQRNTELSGSIFAPTPSELRGNIVSVTDPSRPVIGFIDVSTTVEKYHFIWREDGAYEHVVRCFALGPDEMEHRYGENWGMLIFWGVYLSTAVGYVSPNCVDCRLMDGTGTTQIPENWPNPILR